jgi:branched-chain amino acid transport system substrate-binding protein
MKPVWKTVAAAFAASLIAGAASAQEPIKIGVTQPLTGAFAASGNYVAQGAKIAEDAINAQGGVLGRKIQLVIEDNKSNPTEAAASVEKLISRDKVPVLMGAWSSTLTLAVMPKLMEYQVPMLVETSSSGKITTSGNPYIFRISPTSEMEARAFTPMVKSFNIKKADFLATNNDFGLGASQEFSLILKQAKEQQVKARIITTGGSNSPDQLIQQAGDAANGSFHLVFFTPWFPDAVKNPDVAKRFVAEWQKRGHHVGGLTEGFRGWDGVHTIVEAIKAAGKPDSKAIQKAMWDVKVKGINGDIAFIKQGPAGKESAQNVPSVYVVKIEGGKVVKN